MPRCGHASCVWSYNLYAHDYKFFKNLKQAGFFIIVFIQDFFLNWFFKTISSNNHVNNYELDALPILNHKQLDNDSIKAIQSGNINEIFKSFSLTNEEVNYLQLD